MKFATSMVVLLLASILPSLHAEESATSLTVAVDKPGITVSPSLYGVFFEEINRSGDGGIYAEMINNRSFEDAKEPVAWMIKNGSGVEAKATLDTSKSLNDRNATALRVEVTKAGEGGITLTNEGFKGMAVVGDAKYVATLYARCDDTFKGPINVRIETSNGQHKAEGKVEGVGSEWKKFEVPLTAKDTDTAAKFVVEINSPGVVWLDMVSLFPTDTWKGRPGGLRKDLVQMIADLKPAFVRFPGGCWVEGEHLATSYRWKETIGDIAQRKSNYNLWRYMSTNGLGYHEYLQLCEDVGAAPLYVVNVGMSHDEQRADDRGENVSLDGVQEWIQDALDAIEYANGGTDTKYGAMRAAAGHPESFKLKYIEIGNENGGRTYNERYALFHDAIKKKYPDVQLIANLWRGNLPKNRPLEIIDEHYYNNPGFFLTNADRYDKYDRNGAKIYVGEYAVTQGSGLGNMRAAVGEAAFMCGMERNSDIVTMSSYAPLFSHVKYMVWKPDAINFDASRAYGTPSYWVQQMFGTNRGDVILPVEVKTSTAPMKPHGGIGLGCWNTAAEFKDIKVEKDGKTVYQSDFSKDLSGWKTINGDWNVKDGVLQQTKIAERCLITAGDPSWSNYTLSLKARKTEGREGFLILFNVADQENFTWWNIGGWQNVRHGFELFEDGGSGPMGRSVNGKIDTDRWYDIKIDVKDNHVDAYIDGKKIAQTDYVSPKQVYAVAGRSGDDVVLKIVNAASKPQAIALNLTGAKDIASKATAIELTGNPMDENTLDQPTKIAPETSEITNVSASFTRTFPGNSVTILRVKAK